jgi:hypothetical protein
MTDGVENPSGSGPDPSSLDTVDHYPDGIRPMNLRVVYSSDNLSDYVNLTRSDGQLCLELGPPLFGIVSKAGSINNLKNEVKDALAAIGVSGILTHFSETVVEYAQQLLPSWTIPETIGLGAAVKVIKKLWNKQKLILGYIHHATTDELGNWMKMIENAYEHPDIDAIPQGDGDGYFSDMSNS